MKSPPELPRARLAHAVVLAAALTLALAAGRSRKVDLDLKLDSPSPASASPQPAASTQPMETTAGGAIELYRGFYPAETADDAAAFRWMSAHGVILLRHDHATMILTLTGWVPPRAGKTATTLKLEIDQRRVAHFEAPAGRFTRSFTVSDLAPRAGGHRLDIEASHTVATSPPDMRDLGFCLEAIRWQSNAAGVPNDDTG